MSKKEGSELDALPVPVPVPVPVPDAEPDDALIEDEAELSAAELVKERGERGERERERNHKKSK